MMVPPAACLLLLLAVSFSLSDATPPLRQGGHSDSRALQARQSGDATLLNELIALVLPTINRAIAKFVPDPLELNLAGNINAGSLDVSGCTFSANMDYNWGGIQGLSTIAIKTLEVQPGTESISAGLAQSTWKGIFNMAIQSSSIFALSDLGATWNANACGVPFNPSVGGDIITKNATLAGAVELAGSICGGLLSIDVAQILQSLKIGYSSVEANIDNVPPFIGSIVSTVTTELSTLMKTDLINTVEPTIRPIIQQQLSQASTFAPAQVIALNLGFVRNDVARRVQSLVNGTAQILGLSGESP